MPTIEPEKEHRGGVWQETAITAADPLRARVVEAVAMIEAFESVGVTRFDLTLTNVRRKHRGFKAGCEARALRDPDALLPFIEKQERLQQNIIIRPTAAGAFLIQLDDLTREKAEELSDLAFLAIETSPNSFQLWIAVQDGDETITRRLKLGTSADKNASGSVRLCGSITFKEKYAPHFPTVKLISTEPGRTVTAQVLEARGLLAAPEPLIIAPPVFPAPYRSKRWPDYSRCLADAPEARTHKGKDRSAADINFAILCVEWGHSIEETAAKLKEVSEKAKERRDNYALDTAEAAARIVAKRRAMG